jgi:2,4-dienoyl-CoA reductase-like NADH-dependent reductase (Old Yellow Enzyme family)
VKTENAVVLVTGANRGIGWNSPVSCLPAVRARSMPARATLPPSRYRVSMIAFAREFLANPDLVERMRTNAGLNRLDKGTFYTAGAKGYTDYPALAA